MPVFLSTVLQAELGCSARPHLDITPSRGPLDKGSKRLLHVHLLLLGWYPDKCPKIYPKRIRKPALGNGAYLLLACLTLGRSAVVRTRLPVYYSGSARGTWKQRIKSCPSFLLFHFTVLPLFSPQSIFYPFSF